ncbi:MAG: hypothetical protein AAFR27_11065, partial [Pseudomonadota bacterium]
RWFNVKEVLPYMDGKTIDYVIDFATYAIIPAYLFYEAQLAPPSVLLLSTFTILMVSAIYYGKEGMVSEDMQFVGFKPTSATRFTKPLAPVKTFSRFFNAFARIMSP